MLRSAMLGLGLVLVACSGEPDGVPDASGGEDTSDWHWGGYEPVVRILVVDDAPTPEAVAFRASVTTALKAGMVTSLDPRYACQGSDPAEWHSRDIRYVIARPSAADGEPLVTPLAVPGLSVTTHTPLLSMGDAVADTVAQTLELSLADPYDTYRPLRAAKRAFDLLAGFRIPTSSEEGEFRATLPKEYLLELYVLSTRDDAGPTPVSELELPSDYDNGQIYYAEPRIVAPASALRISQWAKTSGTGLWSRSFDELFSDCCVDCSGPFCDAHDIAVDESGAALCKLTVDQYDLNVCDPTRGWKDPGGHPTFVDDHGFKARRCEIVQLEGEHLEKCRQSLECPDCPSGWCKTEVPELVPDSDCSEYGLFGFPIRFVEGSRGDGATVHIRCQTLPF